MKWSPQQEEALKSVGQWLKNPKSPQVFKLFGYAGTGKTTLAKEIAAEVNGHVAFGTFTGKAAYVLKTKGCENATTIHQLIYQPKFKSKEKLEKLERDLVQLRSSLLSQNPNTNLEEDPKMKSLLQEINVERQNMARPAFSLNTESILNETELCIIDECSMVDSVIGQDLLSFGCKVLVLGDPAQLPPVKGTGFFTEGKPDVMLTEIHRQAQENPIIRLATDIRMGRGLTLGLYGDSKVIEKKDLERLEVLQADQVLVGKNKTKAMYNARMRALLGRESTNPEVGDKLVCLANNHNVGLLNGAIWNVKEIALVDDDSISMILNDGVIDLAVDAWLHYFQNRADQLGWFERRDKEQFDYGYALTVHKSQGSQWNNVMIFDESSSFRESKDKWLYTAITRAAEKVTIVR